MARLLFILLASVIAMALFLISHPMLSMQTMHMDEVTISHQNSMKHGHSEENLMGSCCDEIASFHIGCGFLVPQYACIDFFGGSKQVIRMNHGRIWLAVALATVAGVTVYIFLSQSANTQRSDGTELSGEAADFRLTDQNGSQVSLSDFSGKVVVLTFMDSKCADTCPLTAAHFREVSRQLTQNEAKQVVFLGVRVLI